MNKKFPTSDEDSSTPDIRNYQKTRSNGKFPTSDEDSSTPDHANGNANGDGDGFPTSDEDSSTPEAKRTTLGKMRNFDQSWTNLGFFSYHIGVLA